MQAEVVFVLNKKTVEEGKSEEEKEEDTLATPHFYG